MLLVWVCCRRWRQSLYRQAPKKQANHTAMSDIEESWKELQYYKHVLFRGK
jgi:oligoribonuclease (3'-5' exoribonuclease)